MLLTLFDLHKYVGGARTRVDEFKPRFWHSDSWLLTPDFCFANEAGMLLMNKDLKKYVGQQYAERPEGGVSMLRASDS